MTTDTLPSAFCRALGIRHPIVCPPMANCCGGVLAAEVSRAGGLGLVGHANSLENLEAEVEKGRKHLGLKQGNPLPFGVGLVLWKLESPQVSPAEAASLSASFLDYVASLSAHSVWLAFSPNLRDWVARYRAAEARQSHGKRSIVFVMGTSAENTAAAREWVGIDVVVAQGTDAGGHGPGHDMGLPLEKLLHEVAPRFPSESRPFLVAAGGLSSATSISTLLSRHPNVAGVVTGTAFTVATESLWAKPQKELVVRTASAAETDRGLEWDEIRNQMGWEKGIDGRAIRNRTRGRDESVYADGKLDKGEGPNLDEVGVWAGTGVGDVQAIKPAAEILRDLVSTL